MSKQTTKPSFKDVRISKALSYLLRHGAIKEGLTLRPDGYVPLNEILAKPKFKGVTVDEIKHIVETNDKKRFALLEEGNVLYIRANQGHTIQVEKLELQEIKDPKEVPVCIHGTYFKNWRVIKTEGLCRMGRQHIHFAAGELGDKQVISGMRKTCDIWIYINVKAAMQDGYVFYKSANNVILCAGKGEHGILPTYYFEKVVDLRKNKLLEFEKRKLDEKK